MSVCLSVCVVVVHRVVDHGLTQVNEIVYAKWDDTSLWYLSQVVKCTMDRTPQYNLLYMDGYTKDDVPEKEVRKLPSREKNDKLVGKMFFDPGEKKGKNNKGFDAGEFKVLCRQPGKVPSYWCERMTGGGEKREIEPFTMTHVMELVNKYDKE